MARNHSMPVISTRMHTENIERIAALETDVRNLSTDVRALAQSVSVLGDRIATRDKPNWQAIAVGITVVVAIGTAVIAPIQRDVAANDRLSSMRHDAQDAAIAEVRKAIGDAGLGLHQYVDAEVSRDGLQREAKFQERMEEIETQFRWLTDVSNIREREADRKIASLWRKVYNEELPAATLPNVGPHDLGERH